MTGSEFAKLIAPLGPSLERELLILNTFRKQGLVPIAGGGEFAKIRIEKVIAGKNRVLDMEVSSLPAALGTNADPFIIPCWPWTYEIIARESGCVLPSRKLAIDIAKAGSIKLTPHPYPTCNPTKPGKCNGKVGSSSDDGGKYNETGARIVQHNAEVLAELAKRSDYAPGKLVVNGWKDVIYADNLDGKLVAIFGWFFPDGTYTDTPKDRYQGFSTIYEAMYGPDYSHSGRFIHRVWLNGALVSINDIGTDKLLWPLVSDQGSFVFTFPNAANSVPPPAGYPSGSFVPHTANPTAVKTATAAGLVGGTALGATAGFVIGGPIGAAFGGLLGAAIGRA